MPEESAETQTAEAPVSINDPAFGSLEEAFDKAFPATVEKKTTPESSPEPVKAVEPEKAAPEPEKIVPEPAKAPESEFPDFLSGQIEEKKPEPVTVPDVNVDAVGLKELRTHYRTLKETAKAKATEVQTLQRELEEVKKAQGKTPADVEATIRELQQKNQEMSEALEQSWVENHPAIRQKYDAGRQKEVEKAHRILNAVKIDPKQWDRAMSLPLESRLEALEEIHLTMPTAAKDLLSRSESAIDELELEKEQVLADRKGTREKLTQQDLIRQREAIQQHERDTLQRLQNAEKELVDRLGLETLRKSDNPAHAKWNEGVERRRADARKLMLEIDDQDTMARAAYLAVSALDFRELYHRERNGRLEAEKKLKSYDQAEPTLETKGEETPRTDDKLSFGDAVAAAWPRR